MKNTIECPQCHNRIDVETALVDRIKNDYKDEFLKQKLQLEQHYESKMMTLKEKEDNQEAILSEKLKEKEKELFNQTKHKIQKEFSDRLKGLEEEVDQKSSKIQELQKQETELRKKKRELEEKEAAIELETQKLIDKERKELTESIQQQEQEKAFLKIKEKDQLVETLKTQLDDMKRKAEQGSMQSQGEIMELELETVLRSMFPVDLITEVKKGALGADVLQTVRNNLGREVGLIAFESKRTKSFQEGWIEKLKQDMKTHKADIGVIVTEVMPKDLPHFGLKDGVWICSFHEAQGIAAVLRESLLRIFDAKSSQENKGDKMNLLYDYMTSNEFKQQIQAISEGFNQLSKDIESEKKAMARIWKTREKQIEKVLINTIEMYGSVKGIAGNAVGDIPELNLGTKNLLQ